MKVNFGDIRFDSDSRQLWRGCEEKHLSTKAFELLKVLLERRPNAIAKAELHEILWPDTFVSDANLPGLIAEIREAIGDVARAPRFIRTVHGFGYAFGGTATEERQSQGSGSGNMHHWLVWEQGRLPLATGANVIGREGAGILIIDSATVSRRHAQIIIDEQTATVEDLGSKNGTYVRDTPVTAPMPLVDGDQIRVGSVLLTFRTAALGIPTQTLSSIMNGRSTRSNNST